MVPSDLIDLKIYGRHGSKRDYEDKNPFYSHVDLLKSGAFVIRLHFTANNVMRSPNQRWGGENDCKDPYYQNGNIYFSFVNKVWILERPRNSEMSISRFTVPFYQLLVELFSLHMNVGI